ncbi:MAG: AbrB/MazE/SpoVT family DNA-binding domain-containing protein [Ignavibacteriae bacterium]|nr:AbrB/MazE/SpoVT family DNA-binding domain-containing protein [Ignavibacteriota bacterium]
MITKVIRIGNSRGIRIPKSIIEQSGINNEVELVVKNDRIIIKSVSSKRQNWDSVFKEMAKNKDDILLDENSLSKQNSWDKEEWVW